MTIVTRKLEYFLPERLPSNLLIATEGEPSRPLPAGTEVTELLRSKDGSWRLVQAFGHIPTMYKWLHTSEIKVTV